MKNRLCFSTVPYYVVQGWIIDAFYNTSVSPHAVLFKCICPFPTDCNTISASVESDFHSVPPLLGLGLGKSLYAHHFGTSSIELSRDAAALNDDWKMHFRSTHLAKLKNRGTTNKFGWSLRICPMISCNNVLWSKFEYNLHCLKHEETNILDEVKQLKKFRKQQLGRRSRLSKSKRNITDPPPKAVFTYTIDNNTCLIQMHLYFTSYDINQWG